MTEIKKLFKHSSQYFIGNLIAAISGLISYPIFTRIFSVSDYGVLNLVYTIFLFLVALGKFGLQNSVVRFYSEFKSGKRNVDIKQFYSTLIFGSLIISGMISLVAIFILKFLPNNIISNSIFKLISFFIMIVIIRCMGSIVMNLLRAEEKTKAYNIINISQKYISVLLSIFFTFYIVKGLFGFYFGMLVTESVAVSLLIYRLYKRRLLDIVSFSIGFLNESIQYGLPLIAFEFAAIILSLGDRFIIQYYLNSEMVGLYSAGYNLAEYIGFAFIIPLELALSPIYINLWMNKTKIEVQQFLSRSLKYYMLLGIPIIFGLVLISREIIVVLASSKYLPCYRIVPYVIAGVIIYGTYNIFAAGLHIYKKTYLLSLIIFGAGLLNIILNILMIPKMGIEGAALATFLSYIILIVFVIFYSFKSLKFKIDFIPISSYILFSVLMLLVLRNLKFSSLLLNLSFKIILGFLLYSSLIIISDKDVRRKAVSFSTKLLER